MLITHPPIGQFVPYVFVQRCETYKWWARIAEEPYAYKKISDTQYLTTFSAEHPPSKKAMYKSRISGSPRLKKAALHWHRLACEMYAGSEVLSGEEHVFHKFQISRINKSEVFCVVSARA
jgi:hypothetical protein